VSEPCLQQRIPYAIRLAGYPWEDKRVSGGLLEQTSDEVCLGSDVAAADVSNLTFS
jgi:hypothetical protein